MTFTQMLTFAEATAPIVIDGGLGSAAEDRGIDLDHALWSAELIRRGPDTLLAIHAAFADSGARILTTASYQATPLGFAEAGIGTAEGSRIIAESVRVARSAAERRDVPVAGSVGPFGAALGDGAEYTGSYHRSPEEYTAFHRPRIDTLAEAGADLLAIETQPRLDEIAAIIDLADETGLPSWVTVTLQTGTDTSSPTLPDGSTLAEFAEAAAAESAGDRGQLCASISRHSGSERTVPAHGPAAHRLSELGRDLRCGHSDLARRCGSRRRFVAGGGVGPPRCADHRRVLSGASGGHRRTDGADPSLSPQARALTRSG